MKLFNYILGSLFFIDGVLSMVNVNIQHLGEKKGVGFYLFSINAMLTILVGVLMIGIGAILSRLEPRERQEVQAKQTSEGEAPVLTERQEPRLLSASDL